MRLHATNKLLRIIKSKQQSHVTDKPDGLWYGIDNTWLEWCEAESFAGNYKYYYKLNVDESKILTLKSENAVRAFNAEYGVNHTYHNLIDWPAVAAKYSGIEIAPYQWNLRLNRDFFWYYGWDVASGCVWDASAVLGFEEHHPTTIRAP